MFYGMGNGPWMMLIIVNAPPPPFLVHIIRSSHSGVLIYKSVSDFNVTIGQPGDDNFMGRTAFVESNFVTVRFAHTEN